MTAELTHHLHLCLAAIRAAEAGPTPAELAHAPLMETWCVLPSREGAPVLWGKVIDHPRIGTTMISTSRLVSLSPEQGHARCLSRWFRLGMPYPGATRNHSAPRGHRVRLVLGRTADPMDAIVPDMAYPSLDRLAEAAEAAGAA